MASTTLKIAELAPMPRAKKILDPVDLARVAAFFLALLETTNRTKGSAAGFIGGHAGRDELAGFLLDVIGELFAQCLIDLRATKEGAKAQRQSVKPMFDAHGLCLL
jgi:hypothetical protein